MIDTLLLLAPVLVLIIVVLFGFTGCGSFGSAPEPPKQQDPPTQQPPPAQQPPPTTQPPPYAGSVTATTGFLALWPMNETGGNKANATSSIINVDGEYKAGAAPGAQGAFFHKEPNANFAPQLNGTTGYVEVPFNQQFNPSTNPIRFSVEVWVKPAGAIPAGVEQILISSHSTSAGGNHRGYEILLVGTGAGHATVRGQIFHTTDGITSVDITPTAGDPLDWRHVVLTYDGPVDTLRLYVTVTGTAFDKTPREATGNFSPVQAGGGQRPLRFGAGHLQAGGPEKFFAGRLDEVAFYQAVLPDVTVEAHFKLF
jgi:hypothetical protein